MDIQILCEKSSGERTSFGLSRDRPVLCGILSEYLRIFTGYMHPIVPVKKM